jgi:HlyD family secretion protein
MGRHRVGALLAVVAVMALAGFGGWTYFRDQHRVQYRTARVERGDIEAAISATGTPNAVITVEVGSQISGNIMALYADFNTRVKRGQLVARIAPETFEAKVNQARANLDNARAAVLNAKATIAKADADVANAEASLEAARANVARAKVAVLDARIKLKSRVDLFKEGGISAEERDSAQAAYESNEASLAATRAQEQAAESALRSAQAQRQVTVAQLAAAEAQVKQQEAALRQAEVDLDRTYIRAPVDGVVVSRNVDVGQTVAASLQAPTLFQIAQDLTKMQVNTNVDEADIGRVRVGQEATFTVDAYAGEVFKGTVVQIRKAPINVQNVVTYDVVIAVSNQDLRLFPGMTANVRILVDRRENALKVANAALRFRGPDLREQQSQEGGGVETRGRPAGHGPPGPRGDRTSGGSHTIWTLRRDGGPHPVTVVLGITDGNFSELVEGDLEEGQEVIVGAVSPDGGARGGQSRPATQRGPRLF